MDHDFLYASALWMTVFCVEGGAGLAEVFPGDEDGWVKALTTCLTPV